MGEEQLVELKEAFTLFDTKQRNELDAREFKAALRAMEFDVHKPDVAKMFEEVGKKLTQTITFDEFVKILVSRLPDKDSREEVLKTFKLFDSEGTGKIGLKDLKRIVSEIGENIPEEELNDMFDEADRDKDGSINFEDFYKIMRRGNSDPLDDDYEDWENESENAYA